MRDLEEILQTAIRHSIRRQPGFKQFFDQDSEGDYQPSKEFFSGAGKLSSTESMTMGILTELWLEIYGFSMVKTPEWPEDSDGNRLSLGALFWPGSPHVARMFLRLDRDQRQTFSLFLV